MPFFVAGNSTGLKIAGMFATKKKHMKRKRIRPFPTFPGSTELPLLSSGGKKRKRKEERKSVDFKVRLTSKSWLYLWKQTRTLSFFGWEIGMIMVPLQS